MRTPTYLSYSALAQYEKDVEEYYIKSLAESRAPRVPQERPASIGSAFDARVKSSLFADLGLPADQRYEFEALFETQVEAHNRDWARPEAEYVFESYKYSGAYDRILGLLRDSIEPPRFEFDVRGDVCGVPFLAKPDCRFVLPGPIHVIHDWKVNGYCSKSSTSPVKGYMLCSDGYEDLKPSRSNGQAHKQFEPIEIASGAKTFAIDKGYLEDCSPTWADQLSLYGWSLGEKVGDSGVVLSIDQIVAKPIKDSRPLLRVASYRARVRESYQEHLAKRLTSAWKVISSGHIFQNLTREESDVRCQILDDKAMSLKSDGSSDEDWFARVVRPVYRG